jgi:DNA-directed RNA polymerase sigma subunit (sigma70/sigma32)
MTLEEIGRRLGLTRERVRQIEAAALKRLRRLLAARGVDTADLD